MTFVTVEGESPPGSLGGGRSHAQNQKLGEEIMEPEIEALRIHPRYSSGLIFTHTLDHLVQESDIPVSAIYMAEAGETLRFYYFPHSLVWRGNRGN